MTAVIPKPNHDKRRAAIEAALADAAESGVTSAQDGSSWDDFLIYEELEKEGKLTAANLRMAAFDASVDAIGAVAEGASDRRYMLQVGMLKGFMDGSLGSHTAALMEPYADDDEEFRDSAI